MPCDPQSCVTQTALPQDFEDIPGFDYTTPCVHANQTNLPPNHPTVNAACSTDHLVVDKRLNARRHDVQPGPVSRSSEPPQLVQNGSSAASNESDSGGDQRFPWPAKFISAEEGLADRDFKATIDSISRLDSPERKSRQDSAGLKSRTASAEPLRGTPLHALLEDGRRVKAEDRLLIILRDEAQMSWKGIMRRFSQRFGKTPGLAAIQMRYKRLRTRFGLATPNEKRVLKRAFRRYHSEQWTVTSQQVSRSYIPTTSQWA